MPEELGPEEAKYILGAQANLWTEYIKTPEHAEYMAYPRTCALAEVVWTAKEKKNWPDFARRMRGHFSRLDALKVNYAKSYFDVTSSYSKGKINLAALDAALKIRFTTDGKEPVATSREYTGTIEISKNTTLKAAVFENQLQIRTNAGSGLTA